MPAAGDIEAWMISGSRRALSPICLQRQMQMGTDVFVIENPQVSSAISLDLIFRKANLGVSQRSCWSSFRPEHVRGYRSDLIVANACPGNGGARDFFTWLHLHP